MHAVVATRPGGPEVLEYADVATPAPGPHQVLVRAGALGVNFVDTYLRSGTYPFTFPGVLGGEGAGTVAAVGEGVTGWAAGDRVAWSSAASSYAELVAVDAARLVRVPDEVGVEVAAALLTQGLTAHALATAVRPLGPGDVALVHAGAGGVGRLLVQIAVRRGARVIATAGGPEKAALVAALGAQAVVDYASLGDLTHELPAAVRELTGGAGVDVVYDGVGRATFDASLASLRRRGTLVLFGAASGPVPPFDPQRLNRGGSLYLTRPTVGDYVATRAELEARAGDLLAWVADGSLDVLVGARFPLADAAEAHRALEGRRTVGKVLLLPEAAP